MPRVISHLLLLAALLISGAVNASVVDTINAARRNCGAVQPLVSVRLLSDAAKKVARGLKPADAVHSAGYAMTQLASLHLAGFGDERELHSLLLRQSCKIVGDEDAREVGYFQHGNEIWVLIGTSRGEPGSPTRVAMRALMLVNEARAQARQCGDKWFAAANPLKLNSLLTQAAQEHANEMARLRYVDHEGKDGSTPATRVSDTGYQWKIEGENVAAGAGNIDLAISDWLSSPHHCANIMDPRFNEMGIAFAINKNDPQYGVYWTQTFGTPKVAK